MKTSQLLLKNRKTLLTLSTIRDVIDVSKPLIELMGILSFLLRKSSDMQYGDKFQDKWLKLHSPIFTPKLKRMGSYLTPLRLCEDFTKGVHFQHYYALLQLSYSPISLIRIKGIRTGDHDIKIVNFADDTTIFSRDITCLNRIQLIFKLHEDASGSKINFSKAKPYGLKYIIIEIINQDKWNGHNFSLRYLELTLVTLSLITPIGIT